MDAETRHQLKTNELGEALQNLSRLNDPRLVYALVGVILVLGGWTIYRYMQTSQQQAVASAWASVMEAAPTTASADDAGRKALVQVARDRPNAAVGAAAELRLALVDWRAARDDNDASGLERAATSLSAIAANSDVPAAYRASAMYAAAAALEDQHRFDDARALYSQLMAEPAFDGSPFKELASSEVRLLDERMETVTFLPGLPEVTIEDVLPLDDPQPIVTRIDAPESQPAAMDSESIDESDAPTEDQDVTTTAPSDADATGSADEPQPNVPDTPSP